MDGNSFLLLLLLGIYCWAVREEGKKGGVMAGKSILEPTGTSCHRQTEWRSDGKIESPSFLFPVVEKEEEAKISSLQPCRALLMMIAVLACRRLRPSPRST